MPHVALVPFTGFRVREERMLELGMRLPGLAARAQAVASLPALGLLTLAAHNPPHWTCSYHPAPPEEQGLDELAQHILAMGPCVVAISALTASIEAAIHFSSIIRRHNIPVVIGGLHATAVPETLTAHFDAVVIGDGEPVWAQLLSDVEHGNLKPTYRGQGVFDLRESRIPRFDLLNGASPARYTLQTQRGCPFACEFCAASRLLGGFREKPLGNIQREVAAITALDKHPVIELADDNTFAGRRDAGALFEVLSSADAKYFTEADWRIGERPEVLECLADSGCVQVLVGMESLVAQPKGMGAKNASLARIMDAVTAIQEHGVCVIGCFILGCDGETQASIDRLIDFVMASPLADVQLTVQTPFPGTEMYARMKREGRLLSERGWSAYTLFDVAFEPQPMSVQELEAGFIRAVSAIFAPEPSARRNRIRREIWARSKRRSRCD